jgi:hypothetical protein
MIKNKMHRRDFIRGTLSSGIVLASLPLYSYANILSRKSQMKLGLVTYLWGKEWTNQEIISNCEKSGIQGVELRSTHAHGVEISLNTSKRKEIKKCIRIVG